MKVKIKNCGDKKPTASLMFTTNGVKGQILLNAIEKVVINTKENIMNISHHNIPDEIAVDDIIYINVNLTFSMFYELIIDYQENKIIINVRRIR